MKLRVFAMEFNPFSENTYIIADEKGTAAIIDPGCLYDDEQQQVLSIIQKHHLQLERVLLTHCHIDHVMGCKFIYEQLGILPEHHEIEKSMLANANVQGQFFGIDCPSPPAAKSYLVPNTILWVGQIELQIFHTPGHSPGSISFFHAPSKTLFSGDVLFQGSIGRTDLPGGNYETLMQSIYQVLLPLGEDVTVYSGHGPKTTIGREKKCNPFLQ
ncbi:MAG: MBL fold metallo-hydrolase [Bacteroidia bacterium]|jgi:glyoxylase-like metal-dependent hydrolase (beta-lactamase superfamily II)|nr:MAG: MBL fold metallo-hydrolase [Bacteroidia bacterium]